ncbi:MAG: hypothetical protein U1E83_03405 [Methylotetracoccus sp.]
MANRRSCSGGLPLGKYVLLFLLVFTYLAYKLKKAFWQDLH